MQNSVWVKLEKKNMQRKRTEDGHIKAAKLLSRIQESFLINSILILLGILIPSKIRNTVKFMS